MNWNINRKLLTHIRLDLHLHVKLYKTKQNKNQMFSIYNTFMFYIMDAAVKSLCYMDRVKRIWYLSPLRAAKVQASLRMRAVSPEPSLLAHTSSESRGTLKQKARSLAPLNGWTCAVKICHDGMLEDTDSLDAAHITKEYLRGMSWQSRPTALSMALRSNPVSERVWSAPGHVFTTSCIHV